MSRFPERKKKKRPSLDSPSSPSSQSLPTDTAQTKKGQLTIGLEDPQDLVTGDTLNLSDTVTVTKDDTNLGRGDSLSRELEDVVLDLVRGDFEPFGSGALVRKGGSGWSQKEEGQS